MKTYLIGRDFINWATDDDFFLIKKALSPICSFVQKPRESDVIHSVNWFALLSIDTKFLREKIVIAHIPHDIRNMLAQPEYLKIAPYVDHWVVPSSRAYQFANSLGLNCHHIPYIVNRNVFYKIKDRQRLLEKYGLPRDKYLIGSFQRDTEGVDLKTPKYIKGPDIFLEVLKKVDRMNKNVHVVLAGPRRFWLRSKLRQYNIAYSFIGDEFEGKDDININTLNHNVINELYNAIDLYVVSSRLEGGPKAILECAASETKIIATNVGQTDDILDNGQIYSSFIEGSELIMNDITNGYLGQFVSKNYIKTQEFSLESISIKLKDVYGVIQQDKRKAKNHFKILRKKKAQSFLYSIINRNFSKRITIYFKFQQGPWGGGNQFLKALSRQLETLDYRIFTSLSACTRVVLFNSFHIDFKMMSALRRDSRLLVHRIDGPTFFTRENGRSLDDKIFKINNAISNISVFQSSWSLVETLKAGYKPVNPVLIQNASDPLFFYNNKKKKLLSNNSKIRVVSTSWSDNPRKGGAIYRWLDENLDYNKYEYTFIGRSSESFRNIKLIEAVPSEMLGKLLNDHDVYITASKNDACSNALIEALACGLPCLYLNSGGNPEIVGFGGLGFDKAEQIPGLLELVVENYDGFSNLIVPSEISAIATKYVKCFDLV